MSGKILKFTLRSRRDNNDPDEPQEEVVFNRIIILTKSYLLIKRRPFSFIMLFLIFCFSFAALYFDTSQYSFPFFVILIFFGIAYVFGEVFIKTAIVPDELLKKIAEDSLVPTAQKKELGARLQEDGTIRYSVFFEIIRNHRKQYKIDQKLSGPGASALIRYNEEDNAR